MHAIGTAAGLGQPPEPHRSPTVLSPQLPIPLRASGRPSTGAAEPSVPTMMRHRPPGSLDLEGAEGSSRPCPWFRQRSMARPVPPRTEAVGRRSWRRRSQHHPNFGPAAPANLHRPGQAAHPRRCRSRRSDRRDRRRPAPRRSLLLDPDRLAPSSATPEPLARLRPPSGDRRSPKPTRSLPKSAWLQQDNARLDPASDTRRGHHRASKKKLRRCWASRWRRAATSLDRRGRGTRAEQRHDRRGLRGAGGFTRQRAAPARPARRAAGNSAATAAAGSGADRPATAGGARPVARAALRRPGAGRDLRRPAR